MYGWKGAIGGITGLAALACTGVERPAATEARVLPVAAPLPEPVAAPAPPIPPGIVRVAVMVEHEGGGCEIELRQLPAGPTELLVKLPAPCHGPGFIVELHAEDHRALLVDQANHGFELDLRAKTGRLLPRLPHPGTLGIDGKGVVGCAIVADEPDPGRKGLGFEIDGQHYPVAKVAEGGTSLGRTWRLDGDKWAVTATEVLDSASPDAGPPECDVMATFGDHSPLTSYSRPFLAEPAPPAESAAISKAAGRSGTWVGSGGAYPFAVREEWSDGPYWVGPVSIRSSTGWRVLEGTKDFAVAADGLVFALVATEWRLYSSVTGEVSWRSATRPFVWPDVPR